LIQIRIFIEVEVTRICNTGLQAFYGSKVSFHDFRVSLHSSTVSLQSARLFTLMRLRPRFPKMMHIRICNTGRYKKITFSAVFRIRDILVWIRIRNPD
jgi:hypothetical protein